MRALKFFIILQVVDFNLLFYALMLCSLSAVSQSKLPDIKSAAVEKAIQNFVKTSKYFKKEKVFFVSVEDSLTRVEHQKELDSNGRGYSLPVEMFDGIFVAISVETVRYPVSKLGLDKNPVLPSRTFKVGNKLFMWRDEDYALTEETMAVLKDYDLVFDDEGGVRNITEYSLFKSYDATFYYFCRTDLSKFKKKISWISSENLPFPKLKCP
ncbi:MAG: hypothetical protein V4687_18055 [Bacteroidota bacterium]